MPGTASPPPDPTAGSRLLPAARRTPVQAAPTTSSWWRVLVLGRGWLNLHRQRWLGPALVCAPPVGVAMLWAGASRPGQHRRLLTAGAVAWSLALLIVVLFLAVPGAQPATADGVPPVLAGAASTTATASGSPAATGSAPADRSVAVAGGAAIASSAAEVRGTSAPDAGVGGAAVARSEATRAQETPAARSTPQAAGTLAPAAPPASQPPATTGPGRTPVPTRAASPKPPTVTTANPFSACTKEGATAVSPNGWALKCFRTPIGLYWLYGQ